MQRTGGLIDAQDAQLSYLGARQGSVLDDGARQRLYFSSWQKTLVKDRLVNVVSSQLRVAERT